MTENITKEGIEVKVGQVWRDLDKRMNYRTRTVVTVQDGKAHMDGHPKTKVSIRRMHKSSSGWELVKNNPCLDAGFSNIKYGGEDKTALVEALSFGAIPKV